mmetsp:Transcript_12632/g.30830  ORF Transcript_12632/g.30830 Transcript_12632/m.30830 type:complete len:118 (+) Transcript_12632:162-515(+)|eukprot:CAMPEP_0181124616 /NCGR_PEP_ID=MMETSP1071-20121207/26584_1 /TAXON_ID=35127 /ORGANISM="Thalassiosira sp., Strain NH16" /LENGTH=117 /DNA_ID=CAMNT_0023209949 /DNA_START=145 /DNA_END=498 /DNA_ORIENTATION=-
MNVDALTSEKLRNKVRMVQQSCLSCDGRDFTANGDASDLDNDAKKAGLNKRHANPIIGWKAYIFSGPFAGLSGRLNVSKESRARGWYLIDNHVLGGKRVHTPRFSSWSMTARWMWRP